MKRSELNEEQLKVVDKYVVKFGSDKPSYYSEKVQIEISNMIIFI